MTTIGRLLNRIAEHYWELRLGIYTHGSAAAEYDRNKDAVLYSPIPFRAFFKTMKHVPHDVLGGTFLDYGACKGRALILAARYYNFQSIVGVEISPQLCRIASDNIERARAKNASIICGDAATYVPPPNTTVFFFFNPFVGETMKAVIENMRKSLVDNPRRAAVVVCRPKSFLPAIAGQNWLLELAAGEMLSFKWRVFLTRQESVAQSQAL